MSFEVVVFDVNETLLDVAAIEPALAEATGSRITVGEWFSRLLHRSLVANELDRYQSFGSLAVESLLWLADLRGVDLDPSTATRVVSEMARLPAHPDVEAGLSALGGVRLVALTNGQQEVAERQLEHAGIAHHFDSILSVDAVQRFKPAPEVYRHAARSCEVEVGQMLLVAAHDWDVAGAQAAGASGCFLTRQPWGMTGVSPDMEIEAVGDLAGALEG